MKDQIIFSLVISLLIFITFSLAALFTLYYQEKIDSGHVRNLSVNILM